HLILALFQSLSLWSILYKPFFPFQVQPMPEPDFSVQDERLVEGRLRVTLVECSR
ncbi:PDZ domain-containing protein 8, partial [Clarias magur]